MCGLNDSANSTPKEFLCLRVVSVSPFAPFLRDQLIYRALPQAADPGIIGNLYFPDFPDFLDFRIFDIFV